jgi:hypothetical protein
MSNQATYSALVIEHLTLRLETRRLKREIRHLKIRLGISVPLVLVSLLSIVEFRGAMLLPRSLGLPASIMGMILLGPPVVGRGKITTALNALTAAADMDSALGDIEEGYRKKVRSRGKRKAGQWRRRQLLASIPPLMWQAARSWAKAVFSKMAGA